jgi:hypothetical protein
MAELTEGMHAGEFIASEAKGTRSREVLTIDTGDLVAGQVLGKITKGAATPAADAGNAADTGTIASAAVGAGAKPGAYRATCIEPATNAGAFMVTDPDGIEVGIATVAVEFVGGGLTFTITDGTTDFSAGEGFTITVAAGSGKCVAFNQDGTDGTEVAAGILYDNTDATDADQEAVAIVRDAEVNGNDLTWPADIEAAEKTAAIAELAALGIIVR